MSEFSLEHAKNNSEEISDTDAVVNCVFSYEPPIDRSRNYILR